jgi:uncharacterized membrane protein
MPSSIGTAHGWSIPPSGFDFLPLVAVVAAVLLVRFVLLRPLAGWSLAICAVGGTVWSWWVEASGLGLPSLAALVVFVVASRSPAPRGSV